MYIYMLILLTYNESYYYSLLNIFNQKSTLSLQAAHMHYTLSHIKQIVTHTPWLHQTSFS